MTDREPILMCKQLGALRPATQAAQDMLDKLPSLIAYDPLAGGLTWLAREASMFSGSPAIAAGRAAAWNKRYAGTPALGCIGPNGYRHGCIFGLPMKAHRVAWAIFHGAWPVNDIDHVDGCKTNNAIANLRDVDRQTNCQNKSLRSDNSSGEVGVSLGRGRWRARIHVDGKERFLGGFGTKEEAIAARQAASFLYDFHPNHGRKDAPHGR